MKLCAITDEISQDFEHALDVLREYGANHAELRGLWGRNISELDDAQVRRAQEALQMRGMHVACLATPFYKCDLDTDEAAVRGRMHLAQARSRKDQMEMLRRCADLAHRFGTRFLRVFTFWRTGELTPEIEARIIEAFEEPIKIAREEGVVLALENEHSCFVGTGADAARILRALNTDVVRACWDPGNALAAGEIPYPDGYAQIKPFVVHVHIKDGVRSNGDTKWCVVGQGHVDYRGQFRALAKDGYTGAVSLETHYVPEGGTPEDGSRLCLEALRKLIGD